MTEIIALSVAELAERFCCGERQLNRIFHKHFGLSVAALRMELRLLKAASLLRDLDLKIINVAEQCGFSHLGFFNTCFKRRFGNGPGQWRKIVNAGAQAARPTDINTSCRLRQVGLCPWSPQQPHRIPCPRELPEGRTPRSEPLPAVDERIPVGSAEFWTAIPRINGPAPPSVSKPATGLVRTITRSSASVELPSPSRS